MLQISYQKCTMSVLWSLDVDNIDNIDILPTLEPLHLSLKKVFETFNNKRGVKVRGVLNKGLDLKIKLKNANIILSDMSV